MPRQLDQLPPDATNLARRLAALEREVKELRAARRLGSASVGDLRLYAADGTTLLAELGRDTQAGGGGGLWTRGLQDPYNMSAFLGSGALTFRPVEDDLVAVPGGITYDTDSEQYIDLNLTSGALAGTDQQATITLESVFAGGIPYVYVRGSQSGRCDMDVNGVFTAMNIAAGTVAITPSAANTPTSVTVSGLNVEGAFLRAFTSINNPAPGSTAGNNGVTGTGYSNLTSSGMTVWATRQSTTAVTVSWLIVGFDNA
jgi:hypothetical protein